MELKNIHNIASVYSIHESGDDIGTDLIEVKGTSYNSTDTTAFTFRVNDTLISTSASIGIHVKVWVPSATGLKLVEERQFNTYNSDSGRNGLATMLEEIIDNPEEKVFALASFDAIGTNAYLTNVMGKVRAHHWFNQPGLSNGPNHRHPYAAIGTSKLGIIKEVLHSNTTGSDPAIVTASIPYSFINIGASGYGPDLTSGKMMKEVTETSSYGFSHNTIILEDSGAYNIKEGEYLRMTGQRKVDLARQESGAMVSSYFWGSSASNGWINAASHSTSSIEYEDFELYFRWITTSGQTKLNFGHYHMPSGNATGTSFVKNIQVQKCGFNPSPNVHTTISSSVSHITGKNVTESTGNFSLLDPDSYLAMWNSTRNLTNRPNLSDSRIGSGYDTNNVVWFDKVLTDRRMYSIHEGKNFTGDSNRYSDLGYVNIDHTKMYAASIWMYCTEKVNGNNYLGTHTQNTSNSTVPTYSYNYGGSTTNPYSHYISAGNIEKNKWSLLTYFFLPSTMTHADGESFYAKYWSRSSGNFENGSADNLSKTRGGVGSNGGNIRVSKFQPTDGRIHLRWLDYYNRNGAEHKTWWALPAIFEIDPLNIEADGNIFSWNMNETFIPKSF